MLFARLSIKERKLYSLIAAVLVVAFVLGALVGVMSFGGKGNERADNWQASSLAVVEDTLAQYTLISDTSRWYQDPVQARTKGKEEKQKLLEGDPASFTLVGIVEKNGKREALFASVAGTSTQLTRNIKSLVEGDVLVGGWVIKIISANQVEVQQGEEARTMKMYQSGAK
ncbi:hypothetical protein [Cellvibrio fibrivorans]|uniref:Type II secretion system protein GspC N-terminal domain-containing protein n=1 Tax=Cellvibrio fibrivorans TaxID=126350 RepID=A0ABU1UU43_9GAMM|nr:hypothetical protein [Cellvibrio fibrivorans]MDR7088701.1 hypothetical protein [Cellvibrio fibrivorans]